MLGSILSATGYRVGVNTSPHLSEFNERITINGEQITRADIVRYAKMLGELRERINRETDFGYATYFEVVTAMALKYFADSGVDFVVLEVGLGGTYDATNVVEPILTIITDVSLDHTEHLGNTLASVAKNKAGIIKPAIPVITSNLDPEVLAVISRTCMNQNSPFYRLNENFNYKLNDLSMAGINIDYTGISTNLSTVQVPLLGEYQCNNASLVLAAVEILNDRYTTNINEEQIRTGLSRTKWPGRLEVVGRSPYVLLDGAHNPAGAKTLARALELFDYDNLILVFGCSEEKDIQDLIKDLVPKADKIIISQSNNRRAAKPEMIMSAIDQLVGSAIKTAPAIDVKLPVSQAVKLALTQATKNDMVCICGSLFIVGEAREQLLDGNGDDLNKKFRIHY